MPNSTCCICNSAIEGPVQTFGGRTYCQRHYDKLVKHRGHIWTDTAVLVLGLVLFVLAVTLLAPVLRPILQGDGLLIAGIILALVPAIIWLAVFYAQDRLEPEPTVYLIGVFVLGALLASAVGQPLINGFFRVNAWASNTLLLRLVAGILVVGVVQEFLKYAAVRYSVFNSAEYDEQTDGIIYGAAAGLGYATMLNIAYVVGSGGVDLGIGAVRVAVTALAQASFAGVTGYFLGRAKFKQRGPFWLPTGVILAAVLNGVVTVALGQIARAGLQATPLRGLILAAVIAVVTFGVLFVIMRRNARAAIVSHVPGTSEVPGTSAPGTSSRAEPEWAVWAAVIGLLVVGLLVRGAIEGRTQRFSGNGVALSYPAGWSVLRDEQPGQFLHVADAFSPDQTPIGVSVRQLPAAEVGRGAQSLGDLAMMWSNRQGQDLLGYNALGVEPAKVGGKDAVALDYAYVVQPPGAGVPAVMRAEDILLRNGDTLTLVTFAAPADEYEGQTATWRRILASLDVK
ncbi:MAG: PrsW family glutamic-type intramembrane protease [Chloroflexi bacterium]|nr:PrsW family glutamic-type intramembrane protease [Chloroflexota bacterium]